MTTLLDPALDLSLAPLTNTPLASTDVTFEIADQAGDITNFPDPGVLGYYAWVWAREPSFPNVGDAARAGFAERVRVTARDLGLMTLTVTRDGVSPIDLNVSGVTYWLVAPMNAKYVDDIDDRLFDFVGGNLVTAKTVEIDLLLADQIDMGVATPGVGLLRFLEDTANGVSAVTLQSPAALAGDVAITLLDALPGGTEFLQISSGGLLSTTPTVGVTLDQAYDFGGAGAGRVITADTGEVVIVGDGLLLRPTSQIRWETDVASFNYRSIALSDRWEVQFGQQDADASNDTFNTCFVLDRSSGNNRIGLNTNTPSDLLHLIDDGSNPARIRLQTNVAAVDISIMFLEQTTSRWEIGYDDSAGGFVVGRLTFANPATFVEDTTGRFGVGTAAPGTTRMEIVTSGDEVGLIVDASGQLSLPTMSLLSETTSLSQFGELRFTQRLATTGPVNSIAGEMWYIVDEDRFFFNCGAGERAQVTGAVNFAGLGSNQRQIDTGGTVDPVGSIGSIILQSFSGVADDLDDILAEPPYEDGDTITLIALAAHTITIRHLIGNISLDGSANKVLVNNNRLLLQYNGNLNTWFQLTTMMVLP